MFKKKKKEERETKNRKWSLFKQTHGLPQPITPGAKLDNQYAQLLFQGCTAYLFKTEDRKELRVIILPGLEQKYMAETLYSEGELQPDPEVELDISRIPVRAQK